MCFDMSGLVFCLGQLMSEGLLTFSVLIMGG